LEKVQKRIFLHQKDLDDSTSVITVLTVDRSFSRVVAKASSEIDALVVLDHAFASLVKKLESILEFLKSRIYFLGSLP
jgi:hypothetical protein